MRRAFSSGFADPAAAARRGLDRTFIIDVPAGTNTEEFVKALSAFPEDIESAELDGIGGVADVLPDDEFFGRQWGMHNTGQSIDGRVGKPDADIDAPEAWGLPIGGSGSVTVAVVDSGVSPHSEFADRLLPGHNTDDPLTPDLTIDNCPHGTHVAGIVAARGNNAVGVAGVSWNANILPVRVLGHPDPCSGYESAAANGIVWAVDHGADIINVSLQYCLGGQPLQDAAEYAYDHGVLLVAAAGNNNICGVGVLAAPARFSVSLAVGATTSSDLLASFSNWGNGIDVCAPGELIYSTWVNNVYVYKNGTSMATPHVSGLAALIKSAVPAATHDDIRTAITVSADDVGPVGWDDRCGYGRINAYAALLYATGPRIIASSPPDAAIDARQPSEPDGSAPDGWTSVDLTFAGNPFGLTIDDFSVAQEGGDMTPLLIVDVLPLGGAVYRVTFDRPISVRAWTTVTHLASNTSVSVGYLPGDVNSDGTSSPSDILSLIDALNGAIGPLPTWSVDIDRSGAARPADVLRLIDLLTGGGAYEPFVGVKLP